MTPVTQSCYSSNCRYTEGMRKKQPRQPVVRNSGAHVMLLYGKMVRRPFTLDELGAIFPKHSSKKRSSETANTLKRRGFCIKHEDGTWQITEEGIRALYDTAGRTSPFSRSD